MRETVKWIRRAAAAMKNPSALFIPCGKQYGKIIWGDYAERVKWIHCMLAGLRDTVR